MVSHGFPVRRGSLLSAGGRSQQRAAEAQDGSTLGGQAAAHAGGEAMPGRPKMMGFEMFVLEDVDRCEKMLIDVNRC